MFSPYITRHDSPTCYYCHEGNKRSTNDGLWKCDSCNMIGTNRHNVTHYVHDHDDEVTVKKPKKKEVKSALSLPKRSLPDNHNSLVRYYPDDGETLHVLVGTKDWLSDAERRNQGVFLRDRYHLKYQPLLFTQGRARVIAHFIDQTITLNVRQDGMLSCDSGYDDLFVSGHLDAENMTLEILWTAEVRHYKLSIEYCDLAKVEYKPSHRPERAYYMWRLAFDVPTPDGPFNTYRMFHNVAIPTTAPKYIHAECIEHFKNRMFGGDTALEDILNQRESQLRCLYLGGL